MRSLNKSLPSSKTTPPEQLLHAFKQAALSVTNLYKAAANNEESARAAGYQDAIEDLLLFLDRENLGLQDGEGWRIRRWATAQHTNSGLLPQSEDDDDAAEEEPSRQAYTPVEDKDTNQMTPTPVTTTASTASILPSEPQHQPQQPVFHFSSAPDHANFEEDDSSSSNMSSTAPIQNTNRTHRPSHRHGRPPVRTTRLQLTNSKRKMPFPDLSDVFNMNFDKADGNDGPGPGEGGSGKRLRLA